MDRQVSGQRHRHQCRRLVAHRAGRGRCHRGYGLSRSGKASTPSSCDQPARTRPHSKISSSSTQVTWVNATLPTPWLYRTTEGSTVASIAADLGIVDTTLSAWLKAARVPIRGRHPRADGGPPAGAESADQELARLRARVAELEANERKLGAERDILRAAAQYFAGGTRWGPASSSSPTTGTPSR